MSDRDGFREMLQSVIANGHTFEECKEVLKASAYISRRYRLPNLISFSLTCCEIADISLDAGFKAFYQYCKANDIPVVIISRYAPRFRFYARLFCLAALAIQFC